MVSKFFGIPSLRLSPLFLRYCTQQTDVKIQNAKCLENLKQDIKLDISNVSINIKEYFLRTPSEFQDVIRYTFDQHGKLLRPHLAYLMAGTANSHNKTNIPIENSNRRLKSFILDSQYKIAMICEMIHAASLVHDDIFDSAKLRRGVKSVFQQFNSSIAAFSGSYIMTNSSILLSSINEPEVIAVLAQVLEDLVTGELLQLNQISNDQLRFQSYLEKTYLKTASLMSNSCKAVTMLSGSNLILSHAAGGFGKHLGIAFQLIDDVLDFEQDEKQLGKPSMGADLRSGVITGPILFAAFQYDQINKMIFRSFSRNDDIERVLELIKSSDGIGQTKLLAEFHLKAALRYLSYFEESLFKSALIEFSYQFVHRYK